MSRVAEEEELCSCWPQNYESVVTALPLRKTSPVTTRSRALWTRESSECYREEKELLSLSENEQDSLVAQPVA